MYHDQITHIAINAERNWFLMDDFAGMNRRHWDDLVPIHFESAFYSLDSFKSGKSSLKRVEVEEVGDVHGKTLLHLQCHFGMDTLSWARAGAIVTGVDFSSAAIQAAKRLASDTGVQAQFIESDIYELPGVLAGQFDIVFTSYGVLLWLPDLTEWARIVAKFLRPGGVFYIIEGHPMAHVLDHADNVKGLRLKHSYCPSNEPVPREDDGSYADRDAHVEHRRTYEFPHTMGEIVTSLLGAGLELEFLHEFPFAAWNVVPSSQMNDDGYVHLTEGDGLVPLLFSIRARKQVR